MSIVARDIDVGRTDDEARLRDAREGRLTVGPETLQINMGHRCNLNCIFCWNHSPLLRSRSSDWLDRRLSRDHVDNIVEALPRLRPGRILVSGQGEPLIHPEVSRLLLAAKQNRIPASIQTNGIAADVEDLCELGVDRLLVNLSAATPDGYERTHPGRGDRLARTVARLEALCDRRPRVTLVAVIQRSNLHELVPLVELATRTRVRALYFKGLELVDGLESLVLDESERAEVRRDLIRARELAVEHGLTLDSTHLEQVLSSDPASRAFTAVSPCYMGWYYLRITCDGEVMFCCKDKQVGHLDDGSLYRIWRSPLYQLHRLSARDLDGSTEIIDAKCQTCSNFARNLEIARR